MSKSKTRPYTASTARDNDNYFAQVATNYAATANPFAYYIWLVEELRTLPDVILNPVVNLVDATSPEHVTVGLRHDIDADPVTAVRSARHLARHGLPGSFYFLHTAPYYGDVHGRSFVRNAALTGWVRALVVAGAEIGLHIDPFGLAADHGIDGAAAVMEELHWLRTQGANVQCTVAHNSAPVYGAENYEVFKEMVLWKRTVRSPNGEVLPLGQLSFVQAGITSDGTWARPRKKVDKRDAEAFVRTHLSQAGVRNEAWMRQYLTANPICDWAVDLQCWIVGRDEWVVGGRDGTFAFAVDGPQMLDFVRRQSRGTSVLFVLHPAYFRL